MTESPSWGDLEARIGRVTEEIEALRKQNRKLSSRLKRLQREASGSSPASSAWESEKRELRDRMLRLVTTLESLL